MDKKKTDEVDFEFPILFSDNEKEGQKARFALEKAGIPFEYPPCTEPTPMLLIGFTCYTGLREIKEFIESERAQKIKGRYKE